ncbi:MAG: ribonuclease HII [Traorella sp.]
MQTSNEYELQWWNEGKGYIVGMDEAGRGPLAGPLVVAAVCFPAGYEHEGIYDSKKVSEKKREEMFQIIQQDALEYHILIVSVEAIDESNIYRATQKAMEELAGMFEHVDGILTDAMPLPHVSKDVISIVKGDQKSVSIAAASILAKVTRDRIMVEYDKIYPEYGFKDHKGYGTKKHLEAIEKYGILDIHRKSYAPIKQKKSEQLKLF